MSVKLHLIIISLIVVVVLTFWSIIRNAPVPVANAPVLSPYSISVIHASWGLNCQNAASAANAGSAFASADASKKIREDNALVAVSKLCNDRSSCDIPLTVEALGEDPAPGCGGKVLSVEYRCFSYDRPWVVTANSGQLSLHCSDKTAPQP